MRVRDSVVVITGASSGIGRATALAFADKGAAVVLAARREAALEEAAAECRERGGRALAVPTDVADAKAVHELARRAVEEFGRIDVWVNNASVFLLGPFLDVPLEDFKRVLDVNIMGYVHGARAALPQMRAQDSGVLINVASVLGGVSQPYTHAYDMSKAAVRMLSGSLRQELQLEGARRLHVCTVLPATMDTPIFANAANYTGRQAQALPPVYAPERVAHEIVALARRPRREVVVGSAGRVLLWQSRRSPAAIEKAMALHAEKTMLGRTPESDTDGNLFQSGPGAAAVHGGWHGSSRTALRRTALLGAVAAGIAVSARRGWLRREQLDEVADAVRRRTPARVADLVEDLRDTGTERASQALGRLQERYPERTEQVRQAVRDLPASAAGARERSEPAVRAARDLLERLPEHRRAAAAAVSAKVPSLAPRRRTLLERLHLRRAPRTPVERLAASAGEARKWLARRAA